MDPASRRQRHETPPSWTILLRPRHCWRDVWMYAGRVAAMEQGVGGLMARWCGEILMTPQASVLSRDASWVDGVELEG